MSNVLYITNESINDSSMGTTDHLGSFEECKEAIIDIKAVLNLANEGLGMARDTYRDLDAKVKELFSEVKNI